MLQQDRTVQTTNPLLSIVLDSPPSRPDPLVSGCSANRSLWTIIYLSARIRLSLMLISSTVTFYDGSIFSPVFLSCCAWSGTEIPSLSQRKARVGEISGKED